MFYLFVVFNFHSFSEEYVNYVDYVTTAAEGDENGVFWNFKTARTGIKS